jgi:hypothetical protein
MVSFDATIPDSCCAKPVPKLSRHLFDTRQDSEDLPFGVYDYVHDRELMLGCIPAATAGAAAALRAAPRVRLVLRTVRLRAAQRHRCPDGHALCARALALASSRVARRCRALCASLRSATASAGASSRRRSPPVRGSATTSASRSSSTRSAAGADRPTANEGRAVPVLGPPRLPIKAPRSARGPMAPRRRRRRRAEGERHPLLPTEVASAFPLRAALRRALSMPARYRNGRIRAGGRAPMRCIESASGKRLCPGSAAAGEGSKH